jgi:hypothetical protein
MIYYAIGMLLFSILIIFYFYKNSQNKTLIKQDRRQRLKDAQDQYNKAFGIETEDKLTEFENIK